MTVAISMTDVVKAFGRTGALDGAAAPSQKGEAA
jgi:hypothetical protein